MVPMGKAERNSLRRRTFRLRRDSGRSFALKDEWAERIRTCLFQSRIWQKSRCVSSRKLTLHIVEDCEWRRVTGKVPEIPYAVCPNHWKKQPRGVAA